MRCRSLGLLALLLGCNGEQVSNGGIPMPVADTDVPQVVAECPSELSCSVGVGEAEFTLVDYDTELVMVHGPQGGWHIDTAVRLDAPNGEPLEVHIIPRVYRASSGRQLAGAQTALDTITRTLTPSDECDEVVEGVALRAVLHESGLSLNDVCELRGVPLRVELVVTDADSNETVCSAVGTAALDEADMAPCGW